MSIISRQIGMSQESNLLYEIIRNLNTLTNVTSKISNDTSVVHIAGTETITGVKTFSPVITASGTVAKGTIISPTITANANGDQLIALDIVPTFIPGSFTNTNQLSLRIPSGGKIGINGSTSYVLYFATNEIAINTPTGGIINFQVGDGQKARITANGNLLINTTTDIFAADKLQIDGNINLVTAGNKIKIQTGTNASAGTTGALTPTVGGSVTTVVTSAVTATSIILLTAQTSGGAPGALRVSAKVATTSFTITSTSATDTSTVGWLIIN